MKLSVVIPIYNELLYIGTVLRRVQNVPMEKEIIVVDDGSFDGTREFLKSIVEPQEAGHREATTRDQWGGPIRTENIKVLFHERNRGKGAALRSGFEVATGDILVIQDADLEYDPHDWLEMVSLITEGKADVVYGSRFYGKPHRALYFHHYLGNRLISTLINALCDITLSDVEVCYKMFRREVLKDLDLSCDGFGFEVEFTVKVARSQKWRIYETGIHYYGRTYAEGKKINWRDGLKALWYIFKFRFLV
ncbi:MAG: glycosyltransferase family 2 protein [Candidatus Methylomirabilales bacterium]